MDPDKEENLSDLVDQDSKLEESSQPKIENTFQDPDPQIKKSNKKLLLWIVFIIGVTAVVAFFLMQRKSSSQPAETPQPSASPTVTVTPSPTPSFNRSAWSLEVLNGTEVSGAAKKLADKLQDLGYKIVKVANADRTDYDQTQLFVSKDLQDQSAALIKDIKDVVKIASVAGELKDSTASARIIIGKD